MVKLDQFIEAGHLAVISSLRFTIESASIHRLPLRFNSFYAVNIMKEFLGFECQQFRPDESEDRAKELISLYRQLEQNHF